MDVTSLKISIRALKRNIAKLKGKTSKKAKLQKERTERKLAKQESLLSKAPTLAAPKKPRSRYFGYLAYIRSPSWAKRREAYFESHPKRCNSCGTASKIHLHHSTYENLFSEKDEDLMPLCGSCHAGLHMVQSAFKMSVEEVTELWMVVASAGNVRKIKVKEFKTLIRNRDKSQSAKEFLMHVLVS